MFFSFVRLSPEPPPGTTLSLRVSCGARLTVVVVREGHVAEELPDKRFRVLSIRFFSSLSWFCVCGKKKEEFRVCLICVPRGENRREVCGQ